MSTSLLSCSRYVALLGLSDGFMRHDPPQTKCALQCLQSVLSLNPGPQIEARTHLQLGVILKERTKNRDLAKHHVEQAVRLD